MQPFCFYFVRNWSSTYGSLLLSVRLRTRRLVLMEVDESFRKGVERLNPIDKTWSNWSNCGTLMVVSASIGQILGWRIHIADDLTDCSLLVRVKWSRQFRACWWERHRIQRKAMHFGWRKFHTRSLGSRFEGKAPARHQTKTFRSCADCSITKLFYSMIPWRIVSLLTSIWMSWRQWSRSKWRFALRNTKRISFAASKISAKWIAFPKKVTSMTNRRNIYIFFLNDLNESNIKSFTDLLLFQAVISYRDEWLNVINHSTSNSSVSVRQPTGKHFLYWRLFTYWNLNSAQVQ